jgi:MFS family permease
MIDFALPLDSQAPLTAPAAATARAWWTLAALIFAYTVAYVDRTMMSLLVGPIRAALHINDVQFSLLLGLAFALFYTFLGIPLARIADHSNRRNLIMAGSAIWSVATSLCGFCNSFATLFAARVGVGVGEASLSPAAYSLLGDVFPRLQLPVALSVYSMAIYLGSGLALIGGGAAIAAMPAINLGPLGHLAPWQAVFPLVGAAGVLVLLVMRAVVEPARQGKVEKLSFSAGCAAVWERRRAYFSIFFGFAAASAVWNGTLAWMPSLFIRRFGWHPGGAGLWIGLAVLVFASSGILMGGRLASWLERHNVASANLWVGMGSAAAVTIILAGFALAATPRAVLALLCLFLFAGAAPWGAAVAALHDITPNRLRAQVAAIYLFGVNLAGIGAGPTLVALYARSFAHRPLACGIACNAMICGGAGLLILALGIAPYRRLARAEQAPPLPM